MKTNLFSCLCLLIFGLAVGLPSLHAHGEHDPKPEPEEQSAAPEDNMYAIEADKSTVAPNDSASPFSRTEPGAKGANESGMKHENHAVAKPGEIHMDHDKQQVKLATHTGVASTQKGYDVAMAVTVFAGLAFGALSFAGRIK